MNAFSDAALLMAAVVGAVLSLIMMIVANKSLDSSVYTWTFYAWLTLTSVAGSWLVLALSKFWEGREGEQFQRRLNQTLLQCFGDAQGC